MDRSRLMRKQLQAMHILFTRIVDSSIFIYFKPGRTAHVLIVYLTVVQKSRNKTTCKLNYVQNESVCLQEKNQKILIFIWKIKIKLGTSGSQTQYKIKISVNGLPQISFFKNTLQIRNSIKIKKKGILMICHTMTKNNLVLHEVK